MIKQDIIHRVATELDITRVQAAEAVNAFFSSVIQALKDGERIELRGFGVLMTKKRKTGIGRNPKTGEIVAIPVGKTIRFKPGKNLSSDLID